MPAFDLRSDEQLLFNELTGITEYEDFIGCTHRAVEKVATHDSNLSIAMMAIKDIDDIERKFGADTREKVLKVVAATLRKHMRGSDNICRTGRDCFTVLMPNTCQQGASSAAIKALAAVSAIELINNGQLIGDISLSIGLVSHKPGENLAEILDRAEKYLNSARKKTHGHIVNQCV